MQQATGFDCPRQWAALNVSLELDSPCFSEHIFHQSYILYLTIPMAVCLTIPTHFIDTVAFYLLVLLHVGSLTVDVFQ